MDSTGGVLLLDGASRTARWCSRASTRTSRQRITWTREGDGVRQLWETSKDDGETWETAFDGRYREGLSQQLGQVQGRDAGEVVELDPAGHPVGEDDGAAGCARTAGSRWVSATATETS